MINRFCLPQYFLILSTPIPLSTPIHLVLYHTQYSHQTQYSHYTQYSHQTEYCHTLSTPSHSLLPPDLVLYHTQYAHNIFQLIQRPHTQFTDFDQKPMFIHHLKPVCTTGVTFAEYILKP